MNLLLDTDVLIAFLRGDQRIRNLLQFDDRFYYSAMTRKELLRKRGLSDRERRVIRALLGRLRLVPIDGRIATAAQNLFQRYHPRGLEIGDSLIAATAVTRKMTLVTLNLKHFQFLEGLSLFPMKQMRKLPRLSQKVTNRNDL